MATVRWADLYRWSLVEVEFGTPKKDIKEQGCVDIQNEYRYGINANNEFSYRHMAIVLSKNLENSSITVLPLTQAKYSDEDNISRVVLKQDQYRYFLYKDTSILIDNITTIEKKVRVKRIVLKWIPLPLRRKIQKAMFNSFK
jgi:putative lipase involved disintegration of autophagic bodies